jgi:ATP-dependent DNA helicase RecG
MQLHDLLTIHFRIKKPQVAALKRLGIITIKDLLYHFPVRYSNIRATKPARDTTSGEQVTIYGILGAPSIKKSFRQKIPMTQATLKDIHGDTITLRWLHQPYVGKMLEEGQSLKISGTIKHDDHAYSMINPEFEKIPDMPIDVHDSLFGDGETIEDLGYPVYPETRSISSRWVYHTIRKILAHEFLESVEDPLPMHIRKQFSLPELRTALIWIHMPKKEADAGAARKRFSFEELFLIQLAKQQDRYRFEQEYTHSYTLDPQDITDFIGRFPFTLTDSQQHAIDDILRDVTSPKPMSRLLEGDVGSGKTAVAATIAYGIISNTPGRQTYGAMQVAYMAPTEVLATQLFESFIGYFKHTNTPIGLITGSGCRKFPSKTDDEEWTSISRAQLQKWIKGGEIPIVIGTHALISKSVDFKHLGMVIIDEQHRFGTKQRFALTKKSGSSPHYLSMTATPIPRTLALTVYGDLDLTILDQVPAGRKPVQTKIIPTVSRDKVYTDIRAQLQAGRQAYVICPRISSPDMDQPLTQQQWAELSPAKRQALRLTSVEKETKRLATEVFPEFTVASMHSKMKKDEKHEIMRQFYAHEIDILVSTSVVEVGVNVPNATNMIIEGAERFGLSQLHQLRGRIQRSSHQPYCYLFVDAKSDTTRNRLKAFLEAKNGFELAEHDLMQRGSGDLGGIKQWGVSDLAMEALRNLKLVEAARTTAREIIYNDPTLENFPVLADILAKQTHDLHLE